jgi:hypothetical protein
MAETDPMSAQTLVEIGKLSHKIDDIASKQGDTQLSIAVILEKIADLPDHEKRIRMLEDDRVHNLDGRLRSLEAFKAKVVVLALTAVALSTGIATVISMFVHHH